MLANMKKSTKLSMPPGGPTDGPPTPRNQNFLGIPILPSTGLSMLSIRIDPALLKRAKIRAIEEETTLQNITIAALDAYLKTPIRPKGDRR